MVILMLTTISLLLLLRQEILLWQVTLGVTGATTLSNTPGVGATTLSSTLAVSGDTGIDGDFDVNNDKFTVAATSGNTVVAGTLGVTGATTLSNTLGVWCYYTIKHSCSWRHRY